MSKKQSKSRRRNFNIMVLRGMYAQMKRMKREQPEIKLYCGDVQFDIDNCLEELGAESQSDREVMGDG